MCASAIPLSFCVVELAAAVWLRPRSRTPPPPLRSPAAPCSRRLFRRRGERFNGAHEKTHEKARVAWCVFSLLWCARGSMVCLQSLVVCESEMGAGWVDTLNTHTHTHTHTHIHANTHPHPHTGAHAFTHARTHSHTLDPCVLLLLRCQGGRSWSVLPVTERAHLSGEALNLCLQTICLRAHFLPHPLHVCTRVCAICCGAVIHACEPIKTCWL